jgi:hypothetical protein
VSQVSKRAQKAAIWLMENTKLSIDNVTADYPYHLELGTWLLSWEQVAKSQKLCAKTYIVSRRSQKLSHAEIIELAQNHGYKEESA